MLLIGLYAQKEHGCGISIKTLPFKVDGPGIESRGRARFSAPVQTGLAAHPASCTMGTGSFPGVKRPGPGADQPPPSSAEVEGRVELYLYSPSGPQWPVIGRTFTFYLTSAITSAVR